MFLTKILHIAPFILIDLMHEQEKKTLSVTRLHFDYAWEYTLYKPHAFINNREV